MPFSEIIDRFCTRNRSKLKQMVTFPCYRGLTNITEQKLIKLYFLLPVSCLHSINFKCNHTKKKRKNSCFHMYMLCNSKKKTSWKWKFLPDWRNRFSWIPEPWNKHMMFEWHRKFRKYLSNKTVINPSRSAPNSCYFLGLKVKFV